MVKVKNRVFGGIYELSDKRKIYIAFRDNKERYHVSKDDEGWCLDYDTLTEIRIEGCHDVAIWVRDTGEFYLTQRERFMDPAFSKHHDFEGHIGRKMKGGSRQRHLPIVSAGVLNYRVKPGEVVIR